MELLSFEFDTEDMTDLMGKVYHEPEPNSPTKGYLIVKNLSPNQARVINRCKAALVREFGTRIAADYIDYQETADPRDIQVWLKYQIESSAYPETYTLITSCQRWVAAQSA